MEKLVINGNINENEIKKAFANTDVSLYFNITPKKAAEINAYDAVFFINSTEDEIAKWVGANHLRITTNESDLLAEIKFFLGIPEKVEIERKFLIEYPDLQKLSSEKLCKAAEIEQCYLTDPYPFRVRKRGIDKDFIYIKTEKRKLSDLVRIEIENLISKEEYNATVTGNKILQKTRYLYVYENQYFEIDVFPFCKDKALLEIELRTENQPFTLPPFINVIKDVTTDNYYKNKQIAARHGVVLYK